VTSLTDGQLVLSVDDNEKNLMLASES